MKITRETDYALRIVQSLADKSTGERGKSASVIAAETDVSAPFTLKILRKLQAAGIVRSFKGSGGGYALAKSPSEITALDVVTAADGPIEIHECLGEDGLCNRPDADKNACLYHHIFGDINKYIVEKLGKVTF